jgi:outer membrane protein TolC
MFHSYGGKRAGLSVLLLLLACSLLRAQEKLLNIQDLIDSAVLHYPVLAQKQLLTEGAKAAVTDARSEYLPRLVAADQLNIGSANAIRGDALPFTPVPSVSAVIRDDNRFDPASGNFATLYGEYLLADFGYRKALLGNAAARVNTLQADADREAYLLKWSICRLYLRILQKRNQLKADAENRNRYESIFRVIRAVTYSGIKPGVDSTLARAEVAKATISYNQTRLALQQLYADLSLQTGIETEKITLDSFRQVFIKQPVETFDLPGDTAYNPLIALYEQNRKALQAEYVLTGKSFLPRVVAGAGLWAKGSSISGQDNYKSFIQGLGYQRFNYVAGIGISYDLFNGVRKHRRLAVTQYRLNALDKELSFQRLSLQNVSAKAAMAARNARVTLDQLPIQARAAEQVYSQKLAQYKAGIADLIDLTNASFVVYRSQTDYLQALGDWYLSTLEKAAATGQLDSFIQKIQ